MACISFGSTANHSKSYCNKYLQERHYKKLIKREAKSQRFRLSLLSFILLSFEATDDAVEDEGGEDGGHEQGDVEAVVDANVTPVENFRKEI